MEKLASDQMRDDYLLRAVIIARFAAHLQERILVLYDDLRRQVEAQVYGSGISDAVRTTTRLKRTKQLLVQLEESLGAHYKTSSRMLTRQLIEFSADQVRWSRQQLNAVFNFDIGAPQLTPTEIRVLVRDSWVTGTPAADWWEQQERNTMLNFKREVQLGVAAGETNEQIVRRLRGAASGARRTVEIDGESRVVPDYVGGVLNTSQRHATGLIITALNSVGNQVNMEVFEMNKDILRGMQALATLDLRTTVLCFSRDGAAWGFDGKPLKESKIRYKFPGPPPWHYFCRTVLIPVLKSWSQLIEEQTGERREGLESMPPGQRASMDGTVSSELDAEAWLKTRSAADQIKLLGKGRWQLWKAGKVTAAQLSNQAGRALTVAELSKF